MTHTMLMLCALVVCFCWPSTVATDYTWNDVSPLDTYVQSDDGFFSWTYMTSHRYEGVTVYVVNMTSQRYQNESFVSRSIWWHIMGVAVPDNIRHSDAAFLYIGGTDNDDVTEPPAENDIFNVIAANLANDTGICGGYIRQVPNQPVVFSNDPTQRSRSEDSIIAWTWRTVADLVTPTEDDQKIILRMPMTKAAKRGLDTIHEVAKDMRPSTHITRYFVFGASKRGWTTWSLAATDRRVVAIMPLVFSMLNIPQTLQSHFMNMDGGWSFAFNPYWRENLTTEFYHPNIDMLWDIEDMYRYRARLEGIPKLEVLSTGDEFFLCDDTLQWWQDMPEPKYMLYLPNAEHIMAPQYLKIYETGVSFVTSILDGYPLPTVQWTMQETAQGGLIVMDTIPQPRNITAWSATTLGNDTRRDFRLAALDAEGSTVLHPVIWRQDLNVVDFGNGYQYGVAAEKVDGEWVGFFMQGTWDGPPPNYYRLVLTTQVNVIPYTRPRGPCLDNADCYGRLV